MGNYTANNKNSDTDEDENFNNGINESAIDKKIWDDHKNGSHKKLWKNSIVPFVINNNVDNNLKLLIKKAINEFNTKTPVKWIKYTNNNNYVEFIQNNNVCCYSEEIGKKGGKQYISLPYPKYPDSSYKTQMICVMHEMMHALGFHHEQARKDEYYHCKSNKHTQYSHKLICFGQYDYKSIMHYRDGWNFVAKNIELHNLADNSKTFSQGDLAGLRRIYGQEKLMLSSNNKVHFGEWHEKCSLQCTKTECVCNACGELPGGVNCGYIGMKGHYSCCLNENKNSFCNSTHSGFWHMKCVSDKCTDTICYCKSCGGGCTYKGNKAHWSCCNQEIFKSVCPNTPYIC